MEEITLSYPEKKVPYFGGCTNMDLRDWFAGQALAGLVAPGNETEWVIKAAYRYADAMIAEKRRGEE